MSDYLTAYRARLQRNHDTFVALAEQLKERGYKVYAPTDQLINFIRIENETSHLWLEFREVPYSWAISHDIDIRQKAGSGRTIKTSYGGENCGNDFTIDELISNMQPNVKTNPHSYLKEI